MKALHVQIALRSVRPQPIIQLSLKGDEDLLAHIDGLGIALVSSQFTEVFVIEYKDLILVARKAGLDAERGMIVV